MKFKFLDHINRYPPVIARENLQDVFPWIAAKTIDDFERRGEGPEGVFYVGRKKLYPTLEFFLWLDSRATFKPQKSLLKKTVNIKLGRKTKAQQRRERLGK